MRRSILHTTCALAFGPLASAAAAQFELTIFHANDAESGLVGYGDEGGAHRFVAVLERERAALGGKPSLMLSSGDNYLAGRQLAASLALLDADPENGRFFDAEVTAALKYDAIVIGNHEFDLGPGVLGQFIERVNRADRQTPFISANLDFTKSQQVGEAAKQHIHPRVVFDFAGTKVGVVGATTHMLDNISQPGDVIVEGDIPRIVQQQIDELRAEGVNIVLLASHLQSISEDVWLIGQLSGVDFAVAGGGDELLANADTLLLPGDDGEIPFGSYPLTEFVQGGVLKPIANADGVTVPVVTSSGQYRYMGRITLHFDESGNLTRYDNLGPVRVVDAVTGLPDGVVGDTIIEREIIQPVLAFSENLDKTVIGTLGEGVVLDGRRTEVRSRETGLGNLVADAMRAQAMHSFELSEPVVGVQNGGGIRNDVVLHAGDEMTLGHTFDVLPFPNFVSIVRGVSPQMLKDTLEHAVARVEHGDGRFLQVSGLRFEYDPQGQARFVDRDGVLRNTGERVRLVVLDDRTVIVEDGRVVSEQAVTIATNDFTARGGDYHNFGELTSQRFSRSPVTYQQAVANLIKSKDGRVHGAAYGPEGEGRIKRVGR